MPDLVVYMPDKNWLILMEAAGSHGPVDATRYSELSALFAESTAGLVYVSCFKTREEMRGYLPEIAWETEVWCADNPTHLIHFNGERFLGPYDQE
jgi:adenine-specific DNA-methyltransferase